MLYKLTLYWKLKLNNIDIDYSATVKYELGDGGDLTALILLQFADSGRDCLDKSPNCMNILIIHLTLTPGHGDPTLYSITTSRPQHYNWGQTLNVWKHALQQLCQWEAIKAIMVDWCCQQAGPIISVLSLMFAYDLILFRDWSLYNGIQGVQCIH